MDKIEKEAIFNYLKEGVRNLEIFMSALDANTRPPESVTEIALSFAARNGATQQAITDWEQQILKLPIKSDALDPEDYDDKNKLYTMSFRN